MNEKFLMVYDVVFDEQGYVKACGRHACMQLIRLANEIEPDVDHGNQETGMMNVQSMRDLHNKITH